jgi:hypothetical protein
MAHHLYQGSITTPDMLVEGHHHTLTVLVPQALVSVLNRAFFFVARYPAGSAAMLSPPDYCSSQFRSLPEFTNDDLSGVEESVSMVGTGGN